MQPWAATSSLEHLLTYKNSGEPDMPPSLNFMLACTFLWSLLLIFGSVYLCWSWRQNTENASQHAEHLRELRDMQQQQADRIRHMSEEYEMNKLARQSLDGTPGSGPGAGSTFDHLFQR